MGIIAVVAGTDFLLFCQVREAQSNSLNTE